MFILISFICFSGSVFSRQIVIGSSDLPYTASTAYDTITFSTSKITTGGSGIYVTANNVTIDLQDDTLEFGTDYSSDVYGIYTGYHKNHLTILGNPASDNGGLILHGGGTNTPDSSYGCINIRTLGGLTRNITITDVDMYITGWDGHNYIHRDQGIDTLTISGGKMTNRVVGFTNRCASTGISILISNKNNSEVVIHDVIIDTWAHGIAAGGQVEIYNCSLLVDVKNDLYSYPSGYTCYSSLGVGGIGLWGMTAGTKIHDNIIVAGIENEGSSGGISTSYSVGTPQNPIEIYNNYINIHRGPDDNYNGVTAKPYKQRWSNKHIHIYDNTFIATAHTDSGSHALAWGDACEGIDLGFTSAAYGSEGSFVDSFTVFERNHIEAYALNSAAKGTGIRLTVRNENLGDNYTFSGAGNVFRNNYWGGSNSGIEFGKSDGGQCNSVLMTGDTIATIGSVDPNYHTYESGDWAGPSVDNIVRDIVYLGEAYDTDISWDPSASATGSDISFERTLQILAMGNNDTAIVNASYSVKDKFNQIVASGFTNSNGIDTAFIKYYHAFMSVDDTNYNDFNIIVEQDGHSDSTTLTINSQSDNSYLSPIFYLDIPGTATTEIDTISPGPIEDLRESDN